MRSTLPHPKPGPRPSGPVVLLVTATLLAGGCEAAAPGDAVPPGGPPPARPPDGLLQDSVLQHVVDLQVERDGAVLAAFLRDERAAVRARAAFALGSVQDSDRAGDLMPLLGDPDPSVRRDAAFALGQLEDSAVADPLLVALEAEEAPAAVDALMTALGKTGGSAHLAALVRIQLPDGFRAARALAVARFGIREVFHPDAVALVAEALLDDDPQVRANAAYFFARSPEPRAWAPAAGAVRRALDGYGSDERAAMHLVLGLAGLGDPGDTPRFIRWLVEGTDWRIRTNAARALSGRVEDPRSLEALLAALDDTSHQVALAAATSLTSTPTLPARALESMQAWIEAHPERWRTSSLLLIPLAVQGRVELVRSWLRGHADAPAAVRASGMLALGAASGEDVTGELMEAVRTEPPRVGAAALRALGQRWRFFRSDTSLHRVYFEVFADALRSGDVALTYGAAPLLADSAFLPLGVLEVLEEVYRGLEPPEDVEPMTAILRALGGIGGPGAETMLRGALENPEPVIRKTAAEALGDLTGREIEVPEVREAPERTVDWPALAALGPAPRLVVETVRGTVVLRLAPLEAPLTVQTIVGFAREGRYDGVPFHRVEPNFVVQGGDFARGDGFGGPGFDIRSELTSIPFRRGTLGMASAGKDTEGSQFFVAHSVQPHLDGRYTSFGWVAEGMEVVDRIRQEDGIIRVTLERGG